MNEFSDTVITAEQISTDTPGAMVAFFDTIPFLIIKIIVAFYCVVVFLDIMMLLYLGDVSKKIRQLKYGDDVIPNRDKTIGKSWEKIRARLDLNDESQWKLAILEAEEFVDKDLIGQGYKGENFSERINNIPQGTFGSLEKIIEIHDIRNEIIRNPDFEISHGRAILAIETFEKFRSQLGIE